MKTLLFFTDTYPGGITEPNFINPEIKELENNFEKIIIVPENKADSSTYTSLSNKFSVDNSVIDKYKLRNEILLLFYLFNPFVLKLLFEERGRIKNRRHFFSFLRYVDKAFFYKRYVEDLILSKVIKPEETIFYSFWFYPVTFALAMLTDKYGISFSCRAHGYDLYDERVVFRSHSIRSYTLSKISHVYPCSKQGRDYMRKQYPAYAYKIDVSYLGCEKKYRIFNPKSEDKKSIKFFTCARLHPVKRLPMTYNILADVAKHFVEINFTWDIVGDGDEREKLEELISENQVHNFSVNLMGAKSNKEVHYIYSNNHIDWGILLSESEGFGISVCEQLAYKIPAIVTTVGGLLEVIDESNGILLSADPTPNELIFKLTKYIENADLYNNICNNAYNKWLNNFNSEITRKKFIRELCFKR